MVELGGKKVVYGFGGEKDGKEGSTRRSVGQLRLRFEGSNLEARRVTKTSRRATRRIGGSSGDVAVGVLMR